MTFEATDAQVGHQGSSAMAEDVYFAESPIHGWGGFTRIDLARGTRVIEYMGEKITKSESHRRCSQNNQCILYLNEEFDLDGNVDWNPVRHLNHSCAPNCEAELIGGQIWIVVHRLIRAGEEITFNYGYDLDAYHEHPCHCGATDCAGYIVAPEFMAHVRAREPQAGALDDGP